MSLFTKKSEQADAIQWNNNPAAVLQWAASHDQPSAITQQVEGGGAAISLGIYSFFAAENSWLIVNSDSSFSCLTDEAFRAAYVVPE